MRKIIASGPEAIQENDWDLIGPVQVKGGTGHSGSAEKSNFWSGSGSESII